MLDAANNLALAQYDHFEYKAANNQILATGHPLTLEMRLSGVAAQATSMTATVSNFAVDAKYLTAFDLSGQVKFVVDSQKRFEATIERAKTHKIAVPTPPVGADHTTVTTDRLTYAGDTNGGEMLVPAKLEYVFDAQGPAQVAVTGEKAKVKGTFAETMTMTAAEGKFRVVRSGESTFNISGGDFGGPVRCRIERAESVAKDVKSRSSLLVTADHLKFNYLATGLELFAEGHVHFEGDRESILAKGDAQDILVKFDATMLLQSATLNTKGQ